MMGRLWKPVALLAVVGATVMILTSCEQEPAVVDPALPVGQSETASGSPAHPAVPQSPFLASHESRAVERPDADDVAPEFHIELERLRRQVTEHPDDSSSRLKLAQMLQDGHRETEAIAEYRAYLAQVPGSREAWLDLAKTYASQGEWESALQACDSLLGRYPDDPAGLYNKGAVAATLGRSAEAKELWLSAANQDRDPQIKMMAELALRRIEE